MRFRWIVLALVAGAFGCAPDVSLIAELRTDLRPGREFGSIATQVTAADGRVVATDATPVFTTSSLLAGMRVLESHGLSPGTYVLSVRLLDRDGAEVAHRDSSVSVSGTTLITVLITRDCRGVFCPGTADAPALSECLAGHCVRPECVVEDPASCPAPTCSAAGDCASAFAAACVEPTCISGACFAMPHDERCGANQWCDPASGCRAIDPADLDAGPGRDAGPIDATVHDAGPSCGPASACDTGRPCETGHLDCSGACVADGFVPAGTECRASSGPCDRAESCNGSSANCPVDRSEPDGTSCGATWSELSCGPFDVDVCMSGACVRDSHFGSSGRPSCGALASLCGFAPGNCCGSGGWFCVAEPGNDIYGSSSDCAQCCQPGRCCMDGNPAGPCS